MASTPAVGAVAGCFSGDRSNGGDDDLDETKVLNTTYGTLPDEINFNTFAGQAFPYTVAHSVFDKYIKVTYGGAHENVLLDSWEYDPDTQTETWNFNEGFNWWNGDPVTAEDHYVIQKIIQYTDGENAEFEEVELVDDYTTELTRRDPINTSLRKNQVADTSLRCRRDIFRPFLERFEDATTDQEIDEIAADLVEFHLDIDQVIEEGHGTSPWKITHYSEQEILLEKHDQHPWSDDINVEAIRWNVCEDSTCDQMIVNDEIDFQTQALFPDTLREEAPDHLQTIANYGAMWMWTLKTNWTNKDALGDRGVRRAILSAIDIPNVVTNNDNVGLPVEDQIGMDPAFAEEWLGEETVDQMIQYPVEADYDRADAFLEQDGYTREDGTVYGPDDEPVKFRFISQTGSGRFITAQTVQRQLDDYGFDIDFVTMDRNQFVPMYYDEMDEWDLCIESHYGGSYSHPLAYYNIDHMFGMNHVHYEGGHEQMREWIEDGVEYSPYNGKPLVPEFPEEVGALEIDGGSQELNLLESNEILTTSGDTELTEEVTKKLAQYWNYNLPDIDIVQRENGAWGDVDNFSWPPEDDSRLNSYRGPIYSMKKGDVDYQ